MLASLLNLVSAVSVVRKTTVTDGSGGLVETTVATVLSKASIWQAGSREAALSDKILKDSTHVLAFQSSELTLVDTDAIVLYNNGTYRVTGHPDDVANRGVITVVGLKRVS